MNELDKFWEWIKNKDYGHFVGWSDSSYRIFDNNGSPIEPTQQMVTGYMYEYIRYKIGNNRHLKYVFYPKISYLYQKDNHYQELIDIIKLLEALND